MTDAVFSQDHDTLAKIFTDDLVFHLRGPHPMAGDHDGLGGFLSVLGSFFEMTNGQIELDTKFCLATDGWAAEFEHATLGNRNGRDPRVAERLRLPVRGRSHRRDVDVPRAPARRRRGLLRLTAGRLSETEERCKPSRMPAPPATAAAGETPGGCCPRSTSTPSTSTTSTGAPPPPTSPASDDDAFAAWTHAYQRCLDEGSVHRAAHFGARIGEALGFMGDLARCRGWIDRVADLLERGRHRLRGAGLPRARARHDAALRGRRHRRRPRPLRAGRQDRRPLRPPRAGRRSPRIAEGRMLIYLGDLAEGMALLDGAMVSIEAGDLSPLATGDAYCTVIDACSELYDLERCRAWTDSFTRWCAAQQELVLYRGHCFMHQAEVTGLLGRWPEALERGPPCVRAPGRPGPPDGAGGRVGDRRRPPPPDRGPRRRRGLLPPRQRARPRPAARARAPPGGARPARRGRRRHPARPGGGGRSDVARAAARALRGDRPRGGRRRRGALGGRGARRDRVDVRHRPAAWPWRDGRWARCSWPKATPPARSSSCARPATSSTASAWSTTRPAPVCS